MSISPSNEYSGLISFRIDWLDLLAVQGSLKSLLQHHNSKPPILWHSTFFIVQLSHPYTTTGKTIALIEYSGLISCRIDWLDLLAVQGSLKSLLQNYNSKPPILWHSTFFIVQLSHPYMTTGKTIALIGLC